MSREPIRQVVRKKWTRRDLMKAVPLGATALGVGGLALVGRDTKAITRTTGTCRFCLMRCGIECTVHDGRLVKVEGNLSSRTRGFVCEHGFALRELVHSDERVQHPVIRRGDAFHEVSWEEAFTFIATKLAEVKAKHGGRALAIQTGWPFVRHPFVNFLHRWARAFGSPNVATVSSLCEASLRMGQALTVGTKYSPELRKVKTLVVWGANPPVTAPTFAHLVAGKADGGTLIVIDPLRTTLAKEATLHLRVRPGSDGALALGLINLVLQKRPVSDALREKTHGLDEPRLRLLRREGGAPNHRVHARVKDACSAKPTFTATSPSVSTRSPTSCSARSLRTSSSNPDNDVPLAVSLRCSVLQLRPSDDAASSSVSGAGSSASVERCSAPTPSPSRWCWLSEAMGKA